MHKRIPLGDLVPGMYIVDLECRWMDHPFARSRFAVESTEQIARIREAGITALVIDTAMGIDVPQRATHEERRVRAMTQATPMVPAPKLKPRVSATEEMGVARKVHHEAASFVQSMMTDVRLGHAVDVAAAGQVVERITSSIFRNAGALLSMCQIHDKDRYTFLHSVSVCAMMVAFSRSLGDDEDTVRELGLGALVHDVGKSLTPDAILNKPGRLTPAEFAVIKRHPEDGHRLLLGKPGIGTVQLDIALQHHERKDGSGYPGGLTLDRISRAGQMAAIVDVYDAISADRVYHKATPPAQALQRIFEWAPRHYNEELVQAFVRCVGIYPVGSLVRLENGRLAIVVDQAENNLLQPTIRVVFDTRVPGYVVPFDVALSQNRNASGSHRIVGVEDAAQWKIDIARFL